MQGVCRRVGRPLCSPHGRWPHAHDHADVHSLLGLHPSLEGGTHEHISTRLSGAKMHMMPPATLREYSSEDDTLGRSCPP